MTQTSWDQARALAGNYPAFDPGADPTTVFGTTNQINAWSTSTSAATGQQVSTPVGSYNANAGDWIPVVLSTTAAVVLPTSSSSVQNIIVSGVSGTGQIPVTVTGSTTLSSTIVPLVPITLSAALTTGSPITSLPVNALGAAVGPGEISMYSTTNIQSWVTTGAAAGATTIPVSSQTPDYAYPTTSTMYGPASITSLPVNALPAAISAGQVVVTNGTVSQSFTTAGAAQSSASISITAAVPVSTFTSGSAVAGSGCQLTGYYGTSASVPINLGDTIAFMPLNNNYVYGNTPSSTSLNAAPAGSTPLNPVMYAPVKWAFINYNTANYQLGSTYLFTSANGTGVGDTIQAGSNGVLAIDGSGTAAIPAVAVGDRVVISDSYAHGTGAPPHPEGVYVVTSVGSASTKWLLTRSSDCNTIAQLTKFWSVQITQGTVFGGGYASVGEIYQFESGQPSIAGFSPGISFIRLAIASTDGIALGPGSVAAGPSASALGQQATATGTNSVALGNTSTASGTTSHALGPSSNATGQQAVALGNASTAAGLNATSIGAAAGAFDNNSFAIASGSQAAIGDSQRQINVVYGGTSGTTPVNLTGNLSKQIQFQNSSLAATYLRTMLITINIVARRSDAYGTDSAWTCQGVLRGNGTAYSWVGGSAPTLTLIAQDSGASTWSPTISVATNTMTISCTGSTGATVRWIAVVTLDEVTY